MDIPQMTLVAWIVVGAIAGFLASEIMVPVRASC